MTSPNGQPNVRESFPVHYYGEGEILLSPDVNGVVGVLSGSPVHVVVPTAGLLFVPVSGTVTVDGATYALQGTSDGSLTATFVVPGAGDIHVQVNLVSADGITHTTDGLLRGQTAGSVVESTVTGLNQVPVAGASVQLFQDVNGTWVPFGSVIRTDVNGAFAYVVPNGRYYAQITKDGSAQMNTPPREVTLNVFNGRVEVIKLPEELQSLDTSKPLGPQITQDASAIASMLVYRAKMLKAMLQSPAVQYAASVAAPILAAFALVNAISAFSLFNLLSYLQYLFTQPFLFFGQRKRKKWGVVYNSLTKKRVELAIVRLVQFDTKLVVQTKVTDKFGRYEFIVKPGKYLLEVVKPGYSFPSVYVKDQKEDVEYVDLYFGGALEAKEGGETFAFNIPLDPVVKEEVPERVLWHKAWMTLRNVLAFSGILVGMVIVCIQSTYVNGLMLLGQICVYLLFRKIAMRRRSQDWGGVYSAKSHKPLQNVVVRIFDKKFNKLLETQVTDRNGKYGFFVGRSMYYVTAEKTGFEKFTSPDIDLSSKDSSVIDVNISLKEKV